MDRKKKFECIRIVKGKYCKETEPTVAMASRAVWKKKSQQLEVKSASELRAKTAKRTKIEFIIRRSVVCAKQRFQRNRIAS